MKYTHSFLLLFILAFLALALAPDDELVVKIDQVTPEDHNYLELKRCIDCKTDGRQMMMRAAGVDEHGEVVIDNRGWLASAHARSQTREAVQGKRECLVCHAPLHLSGDMEDPRQGVQCNACHPDGLKRHLRKSLVINFRPGSPKNKIPSYYFHNPGDGKDMNAQCTFCHIEVHEMKQEIKTEMMAEGDLRCVDCHMPVYGNFQGIFDERMHNLVVSESLPWACASCHDDKDEEWMSTHLGELVEPLEPGSNCNHTPEAWDFSQYIDQQPPWIGAELFARYFISTNLHEHSSLAFSPEGNEVYWSVGFPDYHVILYSEKTDSGWAEPKVAPFSGRFWDDFPTFSPDRKGLYFASKRPLPGIEESDGKNHLWYVEKTEAGWGEPDYIDTLIPGWETILPSFTDDGTLYFFTRNDNGFGGFDIYRSELVEGTYREPENLGEKINTPGNEAFVYVSPNGKYLFYTNWGTDDYDGLMISQRSEDGSWSDGKPVGDAIQPLEGIRFYSLSPDGKYLFYNSQHLRKLGDPGFALNYEQVKSLVNRIEGGNGNYYWVNLDWLLGKTE